MHSDMPRAEHSARDSEREAANGPCARCVSALWPPVHCPSARRSVQTVTQACGRQHLMRASVYVRCVCKVRVCKVRVCKVRVCVRLCVRQHLMRASVYAVAHIDCTLWLWLRGQPTDKTPCATLCSSASKGVFPSRRRIQVAGSMWATVSVSGVAASREYVAVTGTVTGTLDTKVAQGVNITPRAIWSVPVEKA